MENTATIALQEVHSLYQLLQQQLQCAVYWMVRYGEGSLDLDAECGELARNREKNTTDSFLLSCCLISTMMINSLRSFSKSR